MKRRFPDGLPLLDPIEDMGIKDNVFRTVVRVSNEWKVSFQKKLWHGVGREVKCKNLASDILTMADFPP